MPTDVQCVIAFLFDQCGDVIFIRYWTLACGECGGGRRHGFWTYLFRKLTPFGQIPKIPVEEMDYAQVAILTLIAVILIVIGMITYRKRDLEGI